ncbi:MAG: Fic family protein [Clostridium sp.]|uniref:Fic family protein n=1 Tax=Clostridia TaxID=186801 RepID=UPI0029110FD4|nr:Fic family protein [Clostridium sp.]
MYFSTFIPINLLTFLGPAHSTGSIQQKAARLGFDLVKNHAFVDGNKRIGAHAMLVFLALNRI